jgi:hypothetical protein
MKRTIYRDRLGEPVNCGDRVRVYLYRDTYKFEIGTIIETDSKYCNHCITFDNHGYSDFRVDAQPIEKITNINKEGR